MIKYIFGMLEIGTEFGVAIIRMICGDYLGAFLWLALAKLTLMIYTEDKIDV